MGFYKRIAIDSTDQNKWVALGVKVIGVHVTAGVVAGKALVKGVVEGTKGTISGSLTGGSWGSLFGLPGLVVGGVFGGAANGGSKFIYHTGSGLIQSIKEAPEFYQTFFTNSQLSEKDDVNSA